MNTDLWQPRLTWLGMVALILYCGASAQIRLAHAQENEQPLIDDTPAPSIRSTETLRKSFEAAVEDSGKFWLGLNIHEADPALRAQLGLEEHQGLIVGRVADDSPAEKAGVKRHDVLLDAGGAPLGRVRDLTAAVDSAGAKELSLKLLRGGKELTVLVTPAQRSQDVVRFIGPTGMGMVFSGDMRPRPVLPDNVSVTIQREGKKPAAINVKRGDEKWEATEDQLDKLPDDVRRLVAPMIGGMPMMMPLEGNAPPGSGVWFWTLNRDPSPPPPAGIPQGPEGQGPQQFNIPVPPPGRGGVPAPDVGLRGLGGPEVGAGMSLDVLRRLDEMSRRMDQLRDEIRGLREGHPPGPPPEGAPPGQRREGKVGPRPPAGPGPDNDSPPVGPKGV